jgi:hypothetical protein
MSDNTEQNTSTSGEQEANSEETGNSVDRHRSNSPSTTDESGDDIDGWRFGIDDVGPDADADDEDSSRQKAESDESPDRPIIEPEEVVFEHAALVVVGAALVAGLILTAV